MDNAIGDLLVAHNVWVVTSLCVNVTNASKLSSLVNYMVNDLDN